MSVVPQWRPFVTFRGEEPTQDSGEPAQRSIPKLLTATLSRRVSLSTTRRRQTRDKRISSQRSTSTSLILVVGAIPHPSTPASRGFAALPGHIISNYVLLLVLVNARNSESHDIRLVNMVNIRAGSYLGVIPGACFFGIVPQRGFVQGPNGVWFVPEKSKMSFLFSSPENEVGNVCGGWDAVEDEVLGAGISAYKF